MPIISGGSGSGSGGVTQLDYVELTAGTVSITGLSDAAATTLITGASIALDGTTPIIVSLFAPAWDTPNVANASATIVLYDGATDLFRWATTRSTAAGDTVRSPLYLTRRFTPSAGTHQYIAKAWVSSGTGVFYGGLGGAGVNVAAYLRVVSGG